MASSVLVRPKTAADLEAVWNLAERFGGTLHDSSVTVENEVLMASSRPFVQARVVFQDPTRARNFTTIMRTFGFIKEERSRGPLD